MRQQSITASNMAVSPSVFDGNGAFSYLVFVSFFPQWGKQIASQCFNLLDKGKCEKNLNLAGLES